ncbi:phosphotransferase family protein [Streptomyces lydicus]|uniref:phosphotransferase family protein n=1 Tax=Streptomyces lydicus TaxID=47763 RepID=UPI0037A5D909
MTALRSTHQLHLTESVVTKRFTSWGHGEALREWRGLTLLHRYAPGTAPAPLTAALDAEPPEVTMSRIDGTPLRGTVVSRPALRALARTLSAVHRAVPGQVVAATPTGAWHARRVDTHVRDRLARRPVGSWEPVVREALAAGKRWLACARLEAVSGADAVHPVFGLTDGNIANYLYDGDRVRLVDLEDAGRSDRAFELAEIGSHLSTWVDSTFDVDFFLGRFPLTEAESARIGYLRRLNALLWLGKLLSDNGTPRRNPPGTAERQAERVLALL